MVVNPLHINYGTRQILPYKNKAIPPERTKTKQLQALVLIILSEDDGVEVDCDGACPRPPSATGASADGVMISGDGAGAGIGGKSVPKIASGRSTLST